MNTHADKTQENKSRPNVQKDSQKRGGGEPAFQFVDNRPEAIVQRKLQKMVNDSSQVTQLRAFKDVANIRHRVKQVTQLQTIDNNSSSLQRKVLPWANLETSKALEENPKYAINSNDRTVLYGTIGASAPLPSGLYKEGSDMGPPDKDGMKEVFNTWTANVRLLSKTETEELNARINGADRASRTAEQIEDQNNKSQLLSTAQLNAQHARETFGHIEAEVTRTLGRGEIGYVGKNDCRTWASQLCMAIAAQLGGTDRDLPEDNLKPDLAKDENPGMAIGDQMTHYVKNRSWPYHGATVVARDGAGLVTLEAHAGQDLKHPAFHIRQGVVGFARDNATGPEEDRGNPGLDIQIERANASKSQAQRQLQKNEMLLEMYENGETTDLMPLSTFIHQIKRILPPPEYL